MRVAVCSYWYPPTRTIASLRIAKFVKYLPEFGWEPYVFTVAPVTTRYTAAGELSDDAPAGHVFRVPDPSLHVWIDKATGRDSTAASAADAASAGRSSALKRLAYRVYREAVCVPDEAWPWLRHYQAVRDAVTAASVDVVFSSSPPATSHLLARRLSRDLDIPWVADLRDPWADMHTVDRSGLRHQVDLRMERRTLGKASALTTVSATMAESFRARYQAPVHVIMNGYDPDDVPPDVQAEPEAERLALVYTGMLYAGRRTPLLIFQALQQLHDRREIDLSRIVVRLYGRNLAIAERELRDFPQLAGSVELGGEVGYRDALLLQKRATVLLLLEWPDPRAVGVVTGKIFEYLFAGRPILATGPHGGEIERILAATGRGVLAATVDEAAAAIRTMYERFRAVGPDKTEPSTTSIEQFSRRSMTGRLAEVFASVVREHRPSRMTDAQAGVGQDVR